MPKVIVSDWIPDAANLDNPGSVVVTNAVPGPNSYKPFPQLTSLTNALDDYARGAISVVDDTGNVYQYCGDEAKLYELGTATWANVSVGGGYATAAEEVWDMVKWKNQVLATNWTDDPQAITLGAALFADLTTDFRCRTMTVVGDHVVVANTYDGVDGEVPDRVRWSAFNDATDWTVSPVTGSDYRDIQVGAIQRIFGGEYGVVLSTSVFRLSWTGAPTWFRLDETLPGIDTLSHGAAAQIGDTVFLLSSQGFKAVENAHGISHIGAGKVDRFIDQDLDKSYMYRISCVADPTSGRVFWAYPGAGNSGGVPNKIICYDRTLDRWSMIEQDVELLWTAGGIGTTLEGLDSFSASIDALGVSLDSNQWKGTSAHLLAAFDTSNVHGFFDGAPMTATVDTKEVQLYEGFRTRLNAFRPLVSGGTVTAQIGSRSRQSDTVSFGTTLAQSASGRFTQRVNAVFHRFRLSVSGAWDDLIGVQVDKEDARQGERRG